MPEITVSGTLEDLRSKLLAAKATTLYRKSSGWSLFNQDEEWKYETRQDERVCPTCLSFAGQWNGREIPIEFRFWVRQAKNEVYPNTHESHPERTHGDCRCTIFWPDYFFVLKERLYYEMLMNMRAA